MIKEITSVQNPLIKKLLLLQEKSKYRKEEQLFVIDGLKETIMAIENNFEITTIFFLEQFQHEIEQLQTQPTIELIKVSPTVFEKIAYRGNTSKVVSIAKTKQNTLHDIQLNENPLILIIDGVEKPGNIGALLRIADAANCTAILLSDTKTDLYNPNAIRSSVGCIFSQQIAIDSKEQIAEFLKQHNIKLFTTSLKASKNYLSVDFTASSAIVVGTEADGVNEFWENNSNQNIIIPMRGQNDSLNVSNSAAIIIFEALRQRN